MMAMDINLHVWLETVPQSSPPVVIPYVQAGYEGRLRYELQAIKTGAGGSSQVGQSGEVQTTAGQPVALSQFSISAAPTDQCSIDLRLYAQGQLAGRYRFDCPR